MSDYSYKLLQGIVLLILDLPIDDDSKAYRIGRAVALINNGNCL